MMKKLLPIVLMLFICKAAKAQINELFNPEYKPGTVVLFGDTTLNGFILLKENSDIKFKESIDSKEKNTYYNRSIKSLIFEDAIFEYKTVVKKSSEERKALQVEIDGDVILYSDSFLRYFTLYETRIRGVNDREEEVHYYLGKKGQVDVIYLGFPNSYSKSFKKKTEDYFGSCPKLLEKISNRGFERSDIQGIVNFYNNECNKIE